MRIDSSFNHKNYLIKLLLTLFFSLIAFRLLFFHSLPTLFDSPLTDKTTVSSELQIPPENSSLSELPLDPLENEEDQVSPTDMGR
jgi:hypothetical protein